MMLRTSWKTCWVLCGAVVLVVAMLVGQVPADDETSSAKVKGVKATQGKGTVIVLDNTFIKKYMDRATIETEFLVDKVGPIHAPAKDGEVHVAGRAKEVGLPVVAEVMNALAFNAVVQALDDAEGTGTPVKVSGAWRLWCEHAGTTPQVQGMKLKPFNTSNPDHVFEIHPVTRVGNVSALRSFRPTVGFTPKDAERAFRAYENVPCKIKPEGEKTRITTKAVGFNFVEFILQALEEPRDLPDGRAVLCSVHDTDGELLVRRRRMVFVKDTPPEKRARTLVEGGRMRVIGIPRMSLKLINWRLENQTEEGDPLTWDLPYELIIVAVIGQDND